MKEDGSSAQRGIPSHFVYAAVILLIGIAFVASYTYFRYQDLEMKKQAQAKQEQEQVENANKLQSNESLRDMCLSAAEEKFDSALKLNGQETKKGTYSLPSNVMAQLKKEMHDAKELCLKQYPTY